MSIKYCCDICGNDIKDSGNVCRKLEDVTIEVLVKYKETWNGGHICPACVASVMQHGQDVASDRLKPVYRSPLEEMVLSPGKLPFIGNH